MDLTQEEFGERIGLSASYVSELEGGHRPLDEHYLEKAKQMQTEFEKTKSVKPPFLTENYDPYDSIRQKCHEFINQLIDSFGPDEDRLRWFYVELRRRFPINSGMTGEDEILIVRAEDVVDRKLPEDQRRRKAARTKGQTPSPLPGASGATMKGDVEV
jgi:transcriptional regulator with XRE-family HTH domain